MRLPSTRLDALARRDVETVGVESTLVDCAKKMRQAHVGSVIVVAPAGAAMTPLGIVTDRDIVVEAVAPGLDAATLTAGDVMSRPLATAHGDDDLLDALAVMRERGVRRLVILDGDEALLGVVSVQDVLDAVGQQMAAVLGVLQAQQAKEAVMRP